MMGRKEQRVARYSEERARECRENALLAGDVGDTESAREWERLGDRFAERAAGKRMGLR